MNHCDSCEYYDECEYSDGINFCDDCKYNIGCPLKYVSCKAGYDIECNNGWEDREDYCCEDDEEDRFPKDCWKKNCPHFHTRDLSIDDLVCTRDLLKIQCDACDEDWCFYLCPLPNDTRTPKERGAE